MPPSATLIVRALRSFGESIHVRIAAGETRNGQNGQRDLAVPVGATHVSPSTDLGPASQRGRVSFGPPSGNARLSSCPLRCLGHLSVSSSYRQLSPDRQGATLSRLSCLHPQETGAAAGSVNCGVGLFACPCGRCHELRLTSFGILPRLLAFTRLAIALAQQ